MNLDSLAHVARLFAINLLSAEGFPGDVIVRVQELPSSLAILLLKSFVVEVITGKI
jgi:hypothetical protein